MTDLLTIAEAAEPIRDLKDAIEKLAGEWVYFIQCGDKIKIGFSRSLARRFAKMATDLPQTPTLLHIEAGDARLEKMLHREFRALRTRGEWFKADQRIYEHIRRRRIVLGLPEFAEPA